MYIYWTDCPLLPVVFQPGDVVLLAARTDSPPPEYEHAALVVAPCIAKHPTDLQDLVIIGLPESAPLSSLSAKHRLGPPNPVTTCRTRYWRPIVLGSERVGDVQGMWNLAGRACSQEEGQYLADRISSMRHVGFQKDHLRIEPLLSATGEAASGEPLRTNCVGFVCSAFRSIEIHLIDEAFPFEYRSRYAEEAGCRIPRTGHLARALAVGIQHPYRPADPVEAENYCLAFATLRQLKAGTGLDPDDESVGG